MVENFDREPMIISEAHRLGNIQEYYFSKKLEDVRQLRERGVDVINLGIGNPDLAPSSKVVDSLSISASNPSNHGYQGYKGIPELRDAISKFYHKVYGVNLDPESEVLPLLGSKEGISHISMAYINQGDEVLVPNPGYLTYASISHLAQAKVSSYNLDESNNWAVDIDDLERRDLSKVKILWVNYPNMPTGAKGSLALFDHLIQLACKHSFLICHDNPYSMILNKSPLSILQCDGAAEVVLELNSLSKSHNMAGWRLGWLCGNAEYINTVMKVKSNIDSGMFLPIQHGGIEALQASSEWHNKRNKIYEERKIYVLRLLDLLNCSYTDNQSGLFVWAKVNDAVEDVSAFCDELLYDAHVFVTPGKIFGTNGERYIRVSLCNNIDVLKESIRRIELYINKTK